MSALRIFRRESPVNVLGPGIRAVIWVQGCPFGCPFCIVPESWDAQGGQEVTVTELADWAIAQPVEGLTLSGGEPMAQAEALSELIEQVRGRRDCGIVCYTGHTYEQLVAHGSVAQVRLLKRIDLLIDGLYIARHHANLLWRGSTNQRLICLTDRYRDLVESLTAESDCSAGVEFFRDDRGAVAFAGVPGDPDFRAEFTAQMARFGISFDMEMR